jgi:hypothetical protein
MAVQVLAIKLNSLYQSNPLIRHKTRTRATRPQKKGGGAFFNQNSRYSPIIKLSKEINYGVGALLAGAATSAVAVGFSVLANGTMVLYSWEIWAISHYKLEMILMID